MTTADLITAVFLLMAGGATGICLALELKRCRPAAQVTRLESVNYPSNRKEGDLK
jgi:hypothetical protein